MPSYRRPNPSVSPEAILRALKEEELRQEAYVRHLRDLVRRAEQEYRDALGRVSRAEEDELHYAYKDLVQSLTHAYGSAAQAGEAVSIVKELMGRS